MIRIKKPKSMLCGSACLHFYFNIINDHKINVPENLFWITDIAAFLYENNVKHEVSCFQSNLFSDFQSQKLGINHPAYISIRKYLETGCKINILEFTKYHLIKSKLPNTFIITSLLSSLLNDNSTLKGYHYIIIQQSMNKFRIINPGSEHFQIYSLGLEKIVNLINISGNWIIKFV